MACQPCVASLARLHYDTILHSAKALEFLVGSVGADHVLLGSDYPFDMGMTDCVRYVRSLDLPPAYRNSYFFADYPFHWIKRLDIANPGDVYAFVFNTQGSPVDLLVGIDGALYVLKLEGNITRISVP